VRTFQKKNDALLSKIRISRREIFRLLSAAGLAGFLPATGNASELQNLSVLDAGKARQLLAVARTLFPYNFLDDDYYLGIVTSIDSKAAADPAIADTLLGGLSKLPAGFVTLEEAGREAYLQTIENSEFFSLAFNETLNGLYGNPEVSRLFGDEGSSIEFGGYINRGFDDIDWLPVE